MLPWELAHLDDYWLDSAMIVCEVENDPKVKKSIEQRRKREQRRERRSKQGQRSRTKSPDDPDLTVHDGGLDLPE